MIKKSERTKKKYAAAAAELDALENSLSFLQNTIELLPAQHIDYFMVIRHKINSFRVILEHQAAIDHAGKLEYDENDISRIFFSPDRIKNVDYRLRLDELKERE